MLDATQNHKALLTLERLFDWHPTLFPTGRSSMYKIKIGGWPDASHFWFNGKRNDTF